MVDNSNNKKRKEFISEADIATLLQRYDTVTILKLLQEMAYYAEAKMNWNELVKKTSTGITSAREYQLLWRHLAYRDSLVPVGNNARVLDDDSDMECELEASPGVSVDVVTEAVAHVKVMAASYVPSESDIPEDSTVEAPLTINIPYSLHRGPQEPSDSYWSSRGMNITFPVFLPKAAEGHNGNGLASSLAPRKRRKKWSAEEDEELIAAVKRHGEGSWALISKEEFEGERTASQLSQRWGAIRRRTDTSNTSTQTGLQRTEAQMAANRALSLAVGNRLPSKKLAVGMTPMLSSGTIKGAQANGASSGSTLQGQQQPQPQIQALSRATTSVPVAKSRVPVKKTTGNSTSRADLMVTANSVAAAACMSGLATAVTVPKIEPGKNAVSALVPKTEPVKTASTVSMPRPSGISSALNTEPVKTAVAASLPRSSGIISAPKVEPVKTAASAASLPRPSGMISAPKVEPVKTTASVASLPRPSGIISAPKAEPVKTAASAASSPRPSGMISAPKVESVKTTASMPRPSGIISAPKAELVKSAASAASLPCTSGIISSPKAELVKSAASAASFPRPSSMLSAPKADPVKIVPAAATNTKSVGPLNLRHAVNGSPNHTIPSSPFTKPLHMAPLSKGSTIQSNSVPPSFASSRLVPTQRAPAATVVTPQKPSVVAAATVVTPQKPSVGAAATVVTPQKPSVGAAANVVTPQKPSVGSAATVVTPQKPSVGAAVTVTSKPVGVQKEQTQGNRASPLVTATLPPNKTIPANSVIGTAKAVAAKVETPPSLMPKKNEVVGSCTDKSSLDKPPEKESTTTVSPLAVAATKSKPKDEATVTGTGLKEL
ncbi:Homeodomain-like superfamily protein [Arabidopsis thaliana]|uniref:At1g58220 n=1 Tax=Arabidopsis thaliana TaxID=3702 RepID=Q8GZ96_ARATH|nr:Homeodomain-like superfamily protein [Arabidopsis thaliana]AAO64906.1 At1g58220 [Arabidopsis thaliana]AAS10017.1 MYB transcription factor [Arabidopsis thaliana]AEE33515.1 Homeodomain-like superfamily protein [Arabidopsis thaliana]BAC41806.1 putative MYB-family transcription factor [Arabidopsis thaliana]|eukprot:NP_176118.2 Homeodomain-like superfamily protein [Arabidopsis thaliana]